MSIPWDIKIFSWIYESGKYLLPLIFVLWLTWLISVVILRKRKQFLFTSAAFILFFALGTVFTWCGWHYRMELRERYAVVQTDETVCSNKTYNIDLMPYDVKNEYKKNGSRPHYRGVVAQVILTVIVIPLTLLGQLILYLVYFRRRKLEGKIVIPSAPPNWRFRLARAGFIAGAIIAIDNFLFVGFGNIWQLWCCIPLALAVIFGTWKNWRFPALILAVIFFYGGVASCFRDVRLAKNLDFINQMYHNRAGFDFEKVFPPLPDAIAVAEDGSAGMRFKSLQNNTKLYHQFLNSLPKNGFKPLPRGSIVWRYSEDKKFQKKIISGNAFYKDSGKGVGAVAEYTGEYCVLYLVRSMNE